MPLDVDELIAKAQDQRKRKRPEEALVSALAAVEVAPDNSDAWWEVALSRIGLKDTRNAILALEKTVEISPEADGAWARLGTLRLNNGDQEEAKDAFSECLDWHPENIDALEGMSKIYAEEDAKDQDEEEASVLERIERLSYLASGQLNRYGILHYRNGRYHEAIKYWRLNAAADSDPASRFNLGLAYSRDEVSQDADAIDMWRMVLDEWDDYEPAKKRIALLLPRMLDLAKQARTQGATLLAKEQWYEHYMNPFELLNPPEEMGLDDFEPKAIQKLKKILLQEIDLEDGAVSWLPSIKVDKSRAIGLCDELMDDTKREYHWLVFNNKPLMSFLAKGAHVHFLVQEATSEIDTIRVIEDADSGFQEWLGDIFAPQFDRVLCKAIEAGNLVVLECLLDGRRWVPLSHADRCFQNARRGIDRRLQALRDANNRADDEKPTVRLVQGLLNKDNLLGVLNLLPSFFEDFQNEVVHLLRGIAISTCNAHDDVDLARQIVELAREFRFRSADANRHIEEDIKQIEKLIQQERKHEAKKVFGGGKECEITKNGVLYDGRTISTNDVSIIRWGISLSGERAAPIYDFLLVVGADDGRRININWKSSSGIDEQEKHFQDLISACLNYLFPSLVERIVNRLATGRSIIIGPCTVSAQGLHFESKGWIFSDSYMVPWRRVRQSMDNGEVSIRDSQVSKAKVTFPFRDTDNAPVLRALINIKNGEDD